MRFLSLICVGLLVLNRGSTALSQQPTPVGSDPPKARVVVYRYKQYVGKALRPSIICDEKDVVRLQNGRMVVLEVSPGKHSFRSNDQQSVIELYIKPGQDYYIRLDIAAGFWKGHGRLNLMMPEQGAGEVKKMKPVDEDMVEDTLLLAKDFTPTP